MLGSLWVPRGKKTPFNNRLIRMERTSWFERLLSAVFVELVIFAFTYAVHIRFMQRIDFVLIFLFL